MRTTKLFLFAILISAFALPVSAASAVQVWRCQTHDGKTQEDVIAVSKAWLDAAKTMKGGEELEVYVGFPIVGAMSLSEFNFVLVANDMETWGTFWNGYNDSPAEKADEEFLKAATCSGSTLESSVKIE